MDEGSPGRHEGDLQPERSCLAIQVPGRRDPGTGVLIRRMREQVRVKELLHGNGDVGSQLVPSKT